MGTDYSELDYPGKRDRVETKMLKRRSTKKEVRIVNMTGCIYIAIHNRVYRGFSSVLGDGEGQHWGRGSNTEAK